MWAWSPRDEKDQPEHIISQRICRSVHVNRSVTFFTSDELLHAARTSCPRFEFLSQTRQTCGPVELGLLNSFPPSVQVVKMDTCRRATAQ